MQAGQTAPGSGSGLGARARARPHSVTPAVVCAAQPRHIRSAARRTTGYPQQAVAFPRIGLQAAPTHGSSLAVAGPRRRTCRRADGLGCRASSASVPMPSSNDNTGSRSRGDPGLIGDRESTRSYTDTLASTQFHAAIGSAPLPPPPKSADLPDILIYLGRLAASDTGLLWRLGIALLLLGIAKTGGILTPLLFKYAVDALVLPAGATPPPLWILPSMGAVTALLVMGAVKALSAICNDLRSVIFTPVGQNAGRRVATHAFLHVLHLDPAFHLDQNTGALNRRLERGIRSVSMIFRAVLFTFLPTVVELVLVCAILWQTFSGYLALAVLGTFVAYVAYTASLTQVAADRRKEVNRRDEIATGKAVDALLNVETVRQFDNQYFEAEKYDLLVKDYQVAAQRSEYISAALNGGQGVILAMGMAFCLSFAAYGCMMGTSTLGDVVLCNGLLLQLWAPLQFLGFFYRELRQSLVDMEKLFHILGTSTNVKDGVIELPATAKEVGSGTDSNSAGQQSNGDAGASNGDSALERGTNGQAVNLTGMHVLMRDVHFGYRDDRMVLSGVTLAAKPGESIAVVGPSGSGKSTLIKLLLRLYDINEGSITLDGYRISDLTLESLYRSAAIVPQETPLFNDTIFNNIAYSCPDASPADVERAAKASELHDTIMRMPQQYDTLVGERGLKLSGGEKQRVAIARAVLRNPRLLVGVGRFPILCLILCHVLRLADANTRWDHRCVMKQQAPLTRARR